MTKIFYKDKIFPNQKFNNELFDKSKGDFNEIIFDILNNQDQDIVKNQKKFIFKEHHRVPFEEMSTPPVQVTLLKFLLKLINGNTFLEIGTFLGSTSMHVASFLGENSKIVTIEKFSEFAELAQENIKINGFSKNIQVIQGDARIIMKNIENNFFDLIYVDGDKGNYLKLTKLAEEKLSSKGIILVDDIFFHGDALNKDPVTEKGKGCKETIEYYSKSNNYNKYILPLNNGILLLKRKNK